MLGFFSYQIVFCVIFWKMKKNIYTLCSFIINVYSMVTVTFADDIKISDKENVSIADFLWQIDDQMIYEEYLERRLQEVKRAPKSDFINL